MLTNFIRKKILQTESWDIDQTLILAVVILCSIGLVMVSSATLDYSYEKTGSSFYFIIKHSLYMLLGLVSASILSRIKLDFFNDYSKYFLVMSFLFSLVVFVPGLGREINGATRWLDLGFITIQVTEISRLFLLIWICSYLSRNNINEAFNKCLSMVVFLSFLLNLEHYLNN